MSALMVLGVVGSVVAWSFVSGIREVNEPAVDPFNLGSVETRLASVGLDLPVQDLLYVNRDSETYVIKTDPAAEVSTELPSSELRLLSKRGCDRLIVAALLNVGESEWTLFRPRFERVWDELDPCDAPAAR